MSNILFGQMRICRQIQIAIESKLGQNPRLGQFQRCWTYARRQQAFEGHRDQASAHPRKGRIARGAFVKCERFRAAFRFVDLGK